MKTSDFDFELPQHLIAQQPLEDRTAARLMLVDRAAGTFTHYHVRDLPELLQAGDLLVVNKTRVIPARLFGMRSDTGGRVEVLLIEPRSERVWECYYRASGAPKAGREVVFADGGLTGTVLECLGRGRVLLELASERPLLELLSEHGVAPLPPYIKRAAGRSEDSRKDITRYQTMFAEEAGAVAAPTAGLHFTPELMAACEANGITSTAITLHVGPGTFTPVSAENLADHQMESERYVVSEAAACDIREAKSDPARRVVAVGSTSVRTCETIAAEHGTMVAKSGRSELFIHPPYDFKVAQAMLTNFHLPRSTLIMMVSALAGRELILDAYREAVREEYRFYSYGDCMLIV
jgi:S-adenosylmethionine:tRNA ribosyltransferase-isomerase